MLQVLVGGFEAQRGVEDYEFAEAGGKGEGGVLRLALGGEQREERGCVGEEAEDVDGARAGDGGGEVGEACH